MSHNERSLRLLLEELHRRDESMNKLSVYVITYNEEANIARCLESVRWADEIVIVDSMSTDRTAEIARNFTDRIVQKPFEGYGKMRNIALDNCANDWVLALDADEAVSDELRADIQALLAGTPSKEAYLIARKSHFLGRWIRYCGWYPDLRPVLFNRKTLRYRDQLVHESLALTGEAGCLRGDILHFPFRSIEHFLAKHERYAALRAEEMFKAGKRFSFGHLLFNPAAMFLRMFVLKRGFLHGKTGLVLSSLYGYYTVIKYLKLREQGRKKPADA